MDIHNCEMHTLIAVILALLIQWSQILPSNAALCFKNVQKVLTITYSSFAPAILLLYFVPLLTLNQDNQDCLHTCHQMGVQKSHMRLNGYLFPSPMPLLYHLFTCHPGKIKGVIVRLVTVCCLAIYRQPANTFSVNSKVLANKELMFHHLHFC